MLEQSDIDFEERMVSPEAMPSDEDDVDYSLRPKTLNEYIGQEKVNVVEQRIKSINPNAVVNKHRCFFLPETAKDFDFTRFDYVVDAIDTVSGKIEIILQAKKAGVPVISCMGAGNKLDPTAFVVTDIYKTSVCPLARVMRQKLKKLGVQDLKVVYSTEKAMKPNYPPDMPPQRKAAPGSVAFVPSVAGIIAGGEVIKDLIGYSNN